MTCLILDEFVYLCYYPCLLLILVFRWYCHYHWHWHIQLYYVDIFEFMFQACMRAFVFVIDKRTFCNLSYDFCSVSPFFLHLDMIIWQWSSKFYCECMCLCMPFSPYLFPTSSRPVFGHRTISRDFISSLQTKYTHFPFFPSLDRRPFAFFPLHFGEHAVSSPHQTSTFTRIHVFLCFHLVAK